MIDGHSEQQIRKAMKIREIIASDKEEMAECQSDLIDKLNMDDDEAGIVSKSIRDMFLPKLLEAEGIDEDEMPKGFFDKVTDDDDNFDDEPLDVNHDESGEELGEDHEFDADNDANEVGEDEIATIHITVPADKIREVEKALETVLGEMDADSKDQALDHNNNEQGDTNMNKEARKALRKTILAAMAEDEVENVSRKDGFEHAKSEQLFEEDSYNTKKGDLSDPEIDTLDYAENKIPTFTNMIDKMKGLTDSLTETKFDGTPEDTAEFELDFNPFEVPSQGNAELYTDLEIPSEGEVNRKRTVAASALGEFDPDAAEEAVAFALTTAGVDQEDLGKLTFAEALELFKAIRTASAEKEEKAAGLEGEIREHSESEEDPEDEHTRSGRELYSSTDDQYAAMLRKLMKGASEKEDMKDEAGLEVDPGTTITVESKSKDKEEMAKEAELYKARLKTAYAMSTKLATAGILPSAEVDAYAEGMLSDGLTVTAMIRQTKLMLNTAAANAEKLAASSGSVRTASTGISFNPSVRASADLSGASEIQNALRNIGWTMPQVTGMEE